MKIFPFGLCFWEPLNPGCRSTTPRTNYRWISFQPGLHRVALRKNNDLQADIKIPKHLIMSFVLLLTCLSYELQVKLPTGLKERAILAWLGRTLLLHPVMPLLLPSVWTSACKQKYGPWVEHWLIDPKYSLNSASKLTAVQKSSCILLDVIILVYVVKKSSFSSKSVRV